MIKPRVIILFNKTCRFSYGKSRLELSTFTFESLQIFVFEKRGKRTINVFYLLKLYHEHTVYVILF